VALDLKFLSEGAAKNGRNFKSATLQVRARETRSGLIVLLGLDQP
jgi:hypothetical protein